MYLAKALFVFKGKNAFSCSMLFLVFTLNQRNLMELVKQWRWMSQICQGLCVVRFLLILDLLQAQAVLRYLSFSLRVNQEFAHTS